MERRKTLTEEAADLSDRTSNRYFHVRVATLYSILPKTMLPSEMRGMPN